MHILELGGNPRAPSSIPRVIDRMRDALIASSRGECDTPMPMHLDIAGRAAEVHMKSSYRRGGRYFALKIASTFPANLARGLPAGNGMMLLSSAETGEPVALLADAGHLTDVRTAAVSAMVARELGRRDADARHPGNRHSGAAAGPHARRGAAAPDRSGSGAATRSAPKSSRSDLQNLARVAIADSPADVARRDAPDRHGDRLARSAACSRRHRSRAPHLGGRLGRAGEAGTGSRNPAPRRSAAGGFAPAV